MAEQNNPPAATTNLFNKGMVKDLNETFMGEGLWTHARNAVNNSHDGHQGVLGNEPANLKCVQLPYDLIGAIHITDDIWAIFTTDDVNSEIGVFDESKCTYTKVVNDPCLNFKRSHLITGASRRRFDCARPVYWSDGLNPDRFMDLDNPPFKYTETVTDGCAIKNYSNELDCEALRLIPLITNPCLNIEKGKVSGTLPNGSYQAAIAYTINQVKVTDYIGLTEVQSLFSHENTSSSLEITISQMDENFDEFELVILANINAQTVAKRIGYYSTSQGRLYIDRWDTEYPNVPVSQVVFRSEPIEKSDAIYPVGDYLLRVGTYSKFKFNYQPQANQIKAQWVATEYPADYYHKGGNNTGYLRDEQYAFFIRWVYNTGERSESYHIPGRAATDRDNDLVFGDDAFETKEGITMKRWQVYNTAGVDGSFNEYLADGGRVIAKGQMGYWESTERYPDHQPDVWKELCGKPIRHHKFPDETVGAVCNTFTEQGGKIVLLGVQFSDITHPLDHEGNPIASIVGYEILRGSREGNKSIIAKGLLNNMREYTIPGNTTKGLFQNYPYNDLRADAYLTESPNKNKDGELKGQVNVTTPKMTAYRKNIFSFHSPDVSFSNPFLSTSELKLYQQLSGTATGQFQNPYKHPKFKILTNFSDTLTDILGFIGSLSDILKTLGGANLSFEANEDVPVRYDILINPNYAGDYATVLGSGASPLTILQFAAAGTANFLIMGTLISSGIMSRLHKQQYMRLFMYLIPKRQYAAQYVSHGFYNEGLAEREGNIRRKIKDSMYVSPTIHQFGTNYQINNLNGSTYVALETEAEVANPDKSIEDQSRFTLGEVSGNLYENYTKRISSHYGALKFSIPSQYGQLTSIKQLPISGGCVHATTPDKTSRLVSPVLFGGDTYINRFTEKNTMFFFSNWLFGEPDRYEYNYTLYANIPYPRYWVNNIEEHSTLLEQSDDFRSLDARSSALFHVKRGFFYLFNSGVRDFFVESEINLAHRDWEEEVPKRHYDPKRFTDLTTMFRSDMIRSGNYYKYDYSLSISKLFNSHITWGSVLPRDYDPKLYQTCYTYRPNRVVYSLPQQGENKKDGWRVYLPNNFKEFNSPVNSVKSINRTGALFMMERQSPVQFLGAEELRLDATGAKLTIGDGGLFQQPLQSLVNTDESYEYGSSQNRYAVSSNTHGVFWVSQNQGKVFQYAGQLSEISRDGMKWWFAQHLPSRLLQVYPDFPLKDNPVTGVGVQMIYDNTHELLYISKKDKVPKRSDLLYDDNGFYYINGYTTVTVPGPASCPAGYTFQNGTCVKVTTVNPTLTSVTYTDNPNTNNDPTCGDLLTGSVSNNNAFYAYPEQAFYVPAGADKFFIQYEADGRPNRFNVYDSTNTLIASSGWVGDATWNGPWTTYVNGQPTQNLGMGFGTLTIDKPAAFGGTYYLKVEAGPGNPNNMSTGDSWEANVLCSTLPAPPPTTEIQYSCPTGYMLVESKLEKTCVKTEYAQPVATTITKTVPNKVYISLDDPAYFEDASWTISYDPKQKTWLSFHDWKPTFVLPGKQHFMTVDHDSIWKHNMRCDLYCNYYGKDYPFEVEFLSSTGQQVNTVRNLEYMLEVYRYHNGCKDKFHVLDANFDQAMVYNSEQVSGLLELELINKMNPVAQLAYPKIGLSSIQINYTKEEQKYRFNQFWDITKDRGEFNGVNVPMFITSPNGYEYQVNPAYVDYNKTSLERKKFRHNVNRVWLKRHVSGDEKMLFKLSNQKLQPSNR